MSESIRTPAQTRHVVLTGFMGSGKSTVGRLLAARLGWRFADLDEVVAAREGLSVPAIFAQHGEAVFRTAEVAALEQLLQAEDIVIALGGGAPETEAIRLLLQRAGTTVIHLHAPFELLYDRCLAQAEDPAATERPLLGARAAAADRYSRRIAVYAGVAQHSADAGAPTPGAVVGEILDHLGVQVTSC